MQWYDSIPTFSSLLGLEQPNDGLSLHQDATLDFAPGASVEYQSASLGSWIPAKVKSKNPDGTFDLDCKPQVSAGRIRLPKSADRAFRVGEFVEYLSESQGGWIVAKVEDFDGRSNTYRLDCKPAVAPAKLRPMSATTAQQKPRPTKTGLANPSSISGTRRLTPILEGDVDGIEAPSSPLSPVSPVPLFEALDQAAPLQLLRVSATAPWTFQVNEEALRLIESFRAPLAVCTICGPYRSGKSFLLNALTGNAGRAFRVGSTTKACTEGLWIWGSPLEASGSHMLFMDCEGFGNTDSDKTRDVLLMSLCLLISSVFLLNTKGVLNEGHFAALSLVCQLANHVEAPASPGDRPVLFWLLRDFLLELADEDGRQISSDEYLEAALRAKPVKSVDPGRAAATSEVRASLMKFFPERRCRTLVQPVIEESDLQVLSDLPYESLRSDFRIGLESLRSQLLESARSRPKLLPGGQAADGPALSRLIRRLVENLNSGGRMLSLTTAWDQVQHASCETLSQELLQSARSFFNQIRHGGAFPGLGRPLPMPDRELSEALKSARGRFRRRWRDRAVGDEAVRRRYWEELKQQLAEEEKAVEALNEKIAREDLQVGLRAWEEWLREGSDANAADPRSEALQVVLRGGIAAAPGTKSMCEALAVARSARLRSDASMKLLRAELDEKRLAASEALKSSGSTEMEQTRELGRVHGQVQVLQDQLREASQQERKLQEQLFEVEDQWRKEQRALSQALAKTEELEAAHNAKSEALAAYTAKPATAPQAQAPRDVEPREKQPKCQCSLM